MEKRFISMRSVALVKISTVFAKNDSKSSKEAPVIRKLPEVRQITGNPGKILKQKLPFLTIVKNHYDNFYQNWL